MLANGADLSTVRERVVQLLSGYVRGTASHEAVSSSGLFRSEGDVGERVVRSAVRRPSDARCSFCRRDLSEVDRYAPGQNSAICDECIVSAHAALATGGADEKVLTLPPRVTGTPPSDEPDAHEKIVTAIRAAPHDPQVGPQGHVRIIEVRFISPDLAEVRSAGLPGRSTRATIRSSARQSEPAGCGA